MSYPQSAALQKVALVAVFYTIGHSNRTIDDFLGLLRQVSVPAPIRVLIDVRTIPKSSHNPQFNEEALTESLQGVGIAYHRVPKLGGLRSAPPGHAPSPNSFWENESFRNYADYTATRSFREGLQELREMGASQVCAIMCAEALWWRCHRRIITDYLIAAKETVIHILGEGKFERGHVNEAAVIGEDGVLTYPAAQGDLSL